MITVEVVSVGGMTPPVPQSVQIDERGGSAGRSPDCTLVLNDPKRAVSRVHAEFSFRDGGFHVVDQGTNPLRVNGVPLGKGNTSAIRNGDRLTIGPFELEVREDGAAASARTAPPMSASQQWARPPAPVAPPVREPVGHIPPAADSSNVFDDILGIGAGSGSGSSQSADSMFDDLGFGAAPTPPPPPPQPRTAAPPLPPPAAKFGSGSFPDDFDPMAPPPSESQQPAADLDDFEDGFASLLGGNSAPKAPGEGSLDAMFGLSSGSSSGDPFASGPLGKPAPSYSGGTDSGLTQFLGGFNKAAAGPVSDHVPELNSAFTPPKAITPTPLPEAQILDLDAFGPSSEEPVPPPPVVAPPPKIERPAPPPPQVPAARPPMPAQPTPPPRYAPQAPVATQPPVPTGPAAAPSDLLGALMAGLNAQDLVINELTPELMYKIGTLMHESTAGTIALLNARGSVKREMRADVTMIASGRNNPLKFSPDARLALRYLFGPQMPGFMEADEAMRDAYADLRAHEFGFMAGLRAALSAVLKRFEPSQIESRLPEKGGINALVPMNRKGKLWDMFSELYRQIALEAEEDFHALFGREFLRAYEEHIAALERGQQQRRK
ncbi:FHA domain protein [Panacagrimonas perspica]|uniref:FHA domain protein n=2 Tax=Panacagrimonas perspica TaxID=381431 RepID=A0A4R7PB17_9GAMM|nr:type VI secretion system-associated FHA domain protein TagH [Panacagrimonas perspica]TDU31167.1 FHA domain protein [Panacagrimonas perspica]